MGVMLRKYVVVLCFRQIQFEMPQIQNSINIPLKSCYVLKMCSILFQAMMFQFIMCQIFFSRYFWFAVHCPNSIQLKNGPIREREKKKE